MKITSMLLLLFFTSCSRKNEIHKKFRNAIKVGNHEQARLFLQKGSFDIDERVLKLTQLGFAVESRDLDSIKMMLELGANPSNPIDESGQTALSYLASKDEIKLVKLLLKWGVSPILKNQEAYRKLRSKQMKNLLSYQELENYYLENFYSLHFYTNSKDSIACRQFFKFFSSQKSSIDKKNNFLREGQTCRIIGHEDYSSVEVPCFELKISNFDLELLPNQKPKNLKGCGVVPKYETGSPDLLEIFFNGKYLSRTIKLESIGSDLEAVVDKLYELKRQRKIVDSPEL